eukprot:5666708-Pyramimonas_sp.AAC.1
MGTHLDVVVGDVACREHRNLTSGTFQMQGRLACGAGGFKMSRVARPEDAAHSASVSAALKHA